MILNFNFCLFPQRLPKLVVAVLVCLAHMHNNLTHLLINDHLVVAPSSHVSITQPDFNQICSLSNFLACPDMQFTVQQFGCEKDQQKAT
jgi:hypothetical protein